MAGPIDAKPESPHRESGPKLDREAEVVTSKKHGSHN